jgi:hypothetical protein
MHERAEAQSTDGDHKFVIPYEWVTQRGEGVLSGWDLEGHQRRQLTALLVDLEGVDLAAALGTLIYKKGGKNANGIYYSKINGVQALRPRCSVIPDLSNLEREVLRRARKERGESAIPDDAKIETVTYLEGVTKKDNKETPLMTESQAVKRLREIIAERTRRQEIVSHKRGYRK